MYDEYNINSCWYHLSSELVFKLLTVKAAEGWKTAFGMKTLSYFFPAHWVWLSEITVWLDKTSLEYKVSGVAAFSLKLKNIIILTDIGEWFEVDFEKL